MPNANPESHGDELTVAQLAALTGRSVRTMRYRVQLWQKRGFPRVRRVQGQRGDARGVLLVCAADYEAMRTGDAPEAHAA